MSNTSREEKKEVSELILCALKDIIGGKNTNSNGLCHYIKKYANKKCESYAYYNMTILLFDDTMKVACDGWEHYSGDSMYPIIHPEYSKLKMKIVDMNIMFVADNNEAYHGASHGFNNTKSGCYYLGEYGRRRLELVQRMIDVLNCMI